MKTSLTKNSKRRSLAFKAIKQDEIKGVRLLFGYYGIFLMFIGVIVLLPLLMLPFYPEESPYFTAFLIPGLISLLIGAVLFLVLIFHRPKGKLTALEDLLLVVGVWILIILFSAIPFLFYGYNFTQSLFESTSGYTNAGMSIMDWSNEVIPTYKTLENGTTDVINHMLFFHRALTQLIGGTGLVLIVSSAISERSNLNLYLLEGHNDKLLPNLAKSARLIFSIYIGFIIVGTGLYIVFGVTPFDAICHSMAAVATGGFSTKFNNVNTLVAEVSLLGGAWKGVMVELVTELLVVLGGINFVIHYSLFRRKFSALKHYEFIVFFAILLVVYPFVVAGMTQYYGGDLLKGFRYGTFDFFSSMSSAGFQAIDSYQGHIIGGQYLVFPSHTLFLISLLMCAGMQSGSTSGGIKQNRIGLMFMDLGWRFRSSFGKPDTYRVHTTYKFGQKTRVEQSEVNEAETFILMYLSIAFFSGLILSVICSFANVQKRGVNGLEPFNFLDCLFEASSCLGDNGLSVGMTNYHTMPAILWIEMILMLLGRLEIFVFITLGGKVFTNIRDRKYIYNRDKEMADALELHLRESKEQE